MKIGTIMEDSPLRLGKWLTAIASRAYLFEDTLGRVYFVGLVADSHWSTPFTRDIAQDTAVST